MKVAVTGATGFVGSRLVQRLHEQGHQIKVLARNPERARKVFPPSAFQNVEVVGYSPQESGDWQGEVSGCDGVINLAGEPIAERWTPERKQEIMNSRVVGTEKLVEAIGKAEVKPKVLVSASAIGFYGTSDTAEFYETSEPIKQDFLAEVCQGWEAAADKVTSYGTRLVTIRIGIVLGMGGAISKMLTPFRLYAGGPIGSGKQWFSWVHRDDLVSLFIKGLTDGTMDGTYNGTAPNPVRMSELCDALGKVMNRPSWLPVPDFVIETLLGDGAIVVLEGQKVLPERTQSTGFSYAYPKVEPALREIVVE
ncbi:thylakoid membrane protein ThyD [Leptothoe kymatousa]|uniref:TIGR01777 family protein n=1 Tax=Leptothoe kymatousa TAU-MAC 1615 TaxID=2364775 RepID=A0ABS5Y3I5_9CYAN|nr:TIGR01777 family oxidoreductase [Leptothoe kymatousa]MBT9312181.1 TIGR01777 family protein [Leptothoe kymatousa TAU-MAC 1615]